MRRHVDNTYTSTGILKPVSALILFMLVFVVNACLVDDLNPVQNNIEMQPLLSDYNIFEGNPSDLTPANRFTLYELSTELFTDYAEKQRLIKVPEGQRLSSQGDGLPDFPDGTILVKTFYYHHDRRDASKGKRIIETRLQIKSNSKWNVGTYLWNDEQTDARLISTGLNVSVNWIDQNGSSRVISYHIPSGRECATCHNVSDVIMPIGPKLRNLNMEVVREAQTINQLTHLQNAGILEPVQPASLTALPDWQDASLPLHDRARAYLDINCAHCHNPDGYASGTRFYLNYDRSSTSIGSKKDDIVKLMGNGKMPRLGTGIVHEEGLDLIKAYIDTL